MMTWDIEGVRARFPSLARPGPDGRPVAWLDGPAGTQVVDSCSRGVVEHLAYSNSNRHGAFAASEETDALWTETHAAMADLLGASDAAEISFGPSMTNLTLAVSRALGQTYERGDEIIVSRLDHDANVAPWLIIARDHDLTIRWIDIEPDDCTLRLSDLEQALNARTRLVAVGLASNAVGTINPVRQIAELTHAAGAKLWVDAVHAAPHIPIDVEELGADFLVCSAYKFYGPHLGVLWGRRELLEALPVYQVRPAGTAIPGRFETGTLPYELLAGLRGTLNYLEELGVTEGGASGLPGRPDGGRRERFVAAQRAARRYEADLVRQLIERVSAVPGLRVRGITDPAHADDRCPTISFTLDGHRPDEIARFLGDRGLYTWDGDFYAYELVRALGLEADGGLLRVGVVHYNSLAEVERLATALDQLVNSRA